MVLLELLFFGKLPVMVSENCRLASYFTDAAGFITSLFEFPISLLNSPLESRQAANRFGENPAFWPVIFRPFDRNL
jgi:hypothetical protein